MFAWEHTVVLTFSLTIVLFSWELCLLPSNYTYVPSMQLAAGIDLSFFLNLPFSFLLSLPSFLMQPPSKSVASVRNLGSSTIVNQNKAATEQRNLTRNSLPSRTSWPGKHSSGASYADWNHSRRTDLERRKPVSYFCFFSGVLGSRIRKALSNSTGGGGGGAGSGRDDRTAGEWVLESLVSPYREESLAIAKKVKSLR